MLSEAIIVAIISGCFGLMGVVITTYKCCSNNTDNNSPLVSLPEGLPPARVLNVQYGPHGKERITEFLKIENGKYFIELPPDLKMIGSNTVGLMNVFKVFSGTNPGGYRLEVTLNNVRGKIELFIKRFDKNWVFRESLGSPSTITQPAGNGKNILVVKSELGNNGIIYEQVGLMVYSGTNKEGWAKCNIDEAMITHRLINII